LEKKGKKNPKKQDAHGPHRSPEKPWLTKKYFPNAFHFHLPYLTLWGNDFNKLAFVRSQKAFM
jgi:hypothetical protein